MTEDLSRFRFHTGAPLSPLAPETSDFVLFRDLGPVALARFMRGELTRLAGPLSPIVYLRTAAYREPYVDHAGTGRLVLLQPKRAGVWRAGEGPVHIASGRSTAQGLEDVLGVIPGDLPLAEAESLLSSVRNVATLAEALGGKHYHAQLAEELNALDKLNASCARAERYAQPLRKLFQSPRPQDRAKARERMERLDISETDLCSAWHHLPLRRRAHLLLAFQASPELTEKPR